MCEKLDREIDHYKRLAVWIVDERTLKGMTELIQQHEAQKRDLHPEPDQRNDVHG